ncbi:MFS transporter [Paenibacillus enshidis]|uniref:MFS transporter n=1 Tax=Paenibacillus enshidis TaxID=1458439 RepID=A0ABV5AW82_9BACL
MHKRSFTYLIGTQSMSNAADVLYIMALISLIFHGTDSIITAILIPLLRMGTQMISGFFAPLLLARFQLPLILFISQMGQLLLFAILIFHLWMTGPSGGWTIVFILVIALSFLDGWTTPARNSLVPRLAPGAALMKANSLISVSDQTVQLAGWGLSGVLVAVLGAEKTLLLAGGLYAVALVFTALIRDPLETDDRYWLNPHTRVRSEEGAEMAGSPQDDSGHSGKTERWKTMQEGWRLIAASSRLKLLMFIDMVDMLGGSVWVGAFTLAFAQEVLHKGEAWWGYINAAYFAGAIGGGLLVLACTRLLEKRLFGSMVAGMFGYGVLTAFYALNESAALTLLIVLLMGPPAELSIVSRRTLIQKSVGDADLPKVLSAQAVLMNLMFCVSLLLMGWIAERFGIVNLYLFAAGLTGLAALIGLLCRRFFRDHAVSGMH